MRTKRTFTLWLLLTLIVYCSFEIFSYLALKALTYKGVPYTPSYFSLTETDRKNLDTIFNTDRIPITIHPVLGRGLRPNWQSTDGFDVINSQGLRSFTDYSPTPSDGTVRIAAFGDSFTYGSEVHNHESWPHYLEQNNGNLEVLNFGLPGAGLDQAYLRYETEGINFHPDIVLIGYHLENVRRSVNVFRPFIHPQALPITKPRFMLKNQQLALLQNPLQSQEHYEELLNNECEILSKISQHDAYANADGCRQWYHTLSSFRFLDFLKQQVRFYFSESKPDVSIDPHHHTVSYQEDAEAFVITRAIFDAFYQEVLDQGATPLILVFPSRPDMEYVQKNGRKMHQLLIDHLDERGYDYLDFTDIFPKKVGSGSVDDFYVQEYFGHYSPIGNAVVAKTVIEYLQSKNVLAH